MYGFGTTLSNITFTEALERVTTALKAQGFGILSDIDVQATLKARLGVDMPAYRILGACNPPFAHQAMTAEPEIGLLLPCNVVVRELRCGDTTHPHEVEGMAPPPTMTLADRRIRVDFMDPEAVLQLVDNPNMPAIAAQVKARLVNAKTALGGE